MAGRLYLSLSISQPFLNQLCYVLLVHLVISMFRLQKNSSSRLYTYAPLLVTANIAKLGQIFVLAITQSYSLPCMIEIFAWLLSRWKGSSLESKQWPCSSTAVFNAAIQILLNTKQPISQPFLSEFTWNFAWWFTRLKGSSLEATEWSCSIAMLQNL